MVTVKRALVSVSDKTGIVDFALGLHNLGIEILSTGGTAKELRQANVPVVDVSEFTGFPEMLDGRVKTLHPKIHAGLLALRGSLEHMASVKEHGIGLIDMVVVNLYPFEKTTRRQGVTIGEAIENIDIGGPSMLRSAAKNYHSVAVVCDPARYCPVLQELKENKASLSERTLQELGVEVFKVTAHYDSVIYNYLNEQVLNVKDKGNNVSGQSLVLSFAKVQDLRYGENPHQRAAFYRDSNSRSGLAAMNQLWGKELSFNNILDLNAAVNIVREFILPAVVFLKHNNPCGVAENKDLLKAYRDAWNCDRLSAFGGIVSVSRRIDLSLARLIVKSGFLECIVCPGFSADALSLLKDKKNLRLLELPRMSEKVSGQDFKKIDGGILVQDEDAITVEEKSIKIATKKKPSKKEFDSLIFAWKVAKHVKSNAIVLTRGTKTVGIGAGQMSRVDSVFISTRKAGKLAKGSVLASDAFFPKEDAIQLAAKHKIKAIIQPGGSVSDAEIIKACDKYRISMVTTGLRHFKH